MKKTMKDKIITLIVFLLISVMALTSCDIFEDHEDEKSPGSDSKISTQSFENYSLEFVSNGDGTCYVSKIINSYESEEKYDIVIPEESPAGDKVTEVRALFNTEVIPRIILKEDFEEILWNIAEVLAPLYEVSPEEIINEKKAKYFDFFIIRNFFASPLEEGLTEEIRQKITQEYPIVEYIGEFYICYPDITPTQEEELAEKLRQYGYNEKECAEDCRNLKEKVENEITDPKIKNDIIADIPEVYHGFGNNIKSISLPNTIEKIDPSFYSALVDVEEIEFPESLNSITEITKDTFSCCLSLKKVTLNNNVERIGIAAFDHCSSLESIVISNGVTSIDRAAFYGCSSLESIVIPNSVTNIAYEAFGNSKLTDVYYTGTEEEWNQIVIKEGNDVLLSATIHYNYVAE